jgi:hypothetical protein
MVTKNSINNASETLGVGNLSLATNTLSSTTGNIILAPVSGSRVSINSAYTLPSADGTNGQVLTTSGSGTLSFQTPVTTLMPWTRIETGTTAVNLVANNGYIMANTTANVTFTLPATAQVGDTFQILNIISAFDFIIKCSPATELYLGNTPGPFGTSGEVRSTDVGDWVEIVCSDEDSSFIACARQGNFIVTDS